MKNIEGEQNQRLHNLQPLDYHFSKGDIVYIKILSSNKELCDLFNPSDLGVSSYGNYNSSMSFLKGFMVNDSGNITLPIIKSINIEGLTIHEAQRKVQRRVDEYLNNTIVLVKLLSFNVNIIGEVNAPGMKEIFKDKLNILEALARAGDIRETGDKRNVMIIRSTNEQILTYTVDLTDASILSSKEYAIMPNDIIVVQPLKRQAFRLNIPSISIVLSSITTALLIINIFYK